MKVGFVVFLGLLLLALLVSVTGGLRWRQKGFELFVTFPDVRGLEEGGAVLVSGVERGRVSSIELVPGGVRVRLDLASDVAVPRDSRFVIDSGSLLGESRIDVKRGSLSEILKAGEEVDGEIPLSFDEVLSRVGEDLAEVRETFSHVNAFLGDATVQAGLKRSVESLPLLLDEGRATVETIGRAADVYGQLAGDLRGTAASYSLLADEARREMTALGVELRDLSRSLHGVVADNERSIQTALSSLASLLVRLDSVLADFDADGLSGKELRRAIDNLSGAAGEVEKLAKGLREDLLAPEGETGKPSTLSNLKSSAAKADRLLSGMESFRVAGGVALHQATSGFDDGSRLVDIDVDLYRTTSPWRLSLSTEDVGAEDRFSATVGYPLWRGVDLFGGLVRGEPGGGVALRLAPWGVPLSFRWRWWDEDGGAWSIEERLHLSESWGLFHRRMEGRGEDRDSLGIFYRF